MTSINTSLSNYYQLSGQSSAASTSTSPTNTLVDALNSIDSANSASSSNNAYSLNLSSTAQQLLSGSSTSGTNSSSTSFTLTSAQQNQINTILEKYKDAPYDQATFDSIQNDLNAAGLGTAQLSAQDQINSFNPTSVFLSALNGNYASLNTTSDSAATEQTKSANYMQGILSAWKSISTTAASTTSATGAGTSVTSGSSITA